MAPMILRSVPWWILPRCWCPSHISTTEVGATDRFHFVELDQTLEHAPHTTGTADIFGKDCAQESVGGSWQRFFAAFFPQPQRMALRDFHFESQETEFSAVE